VGNHVCDTGAPGDGFAAARCSPASRDEALLDVFGCTTNFHVASCVHAISWISGRFEAWQATQLSRSDPDTGTHPD
jgi:hypothetical protein